MLGYNVNSSPTELLLHHNRLKQKYPVEKHTELNTVYKWVSNPDFLKAWEANTVENWDWLMTSMLNPPDSVIRQRMVETTNHTVLPTPTFSRQLSGPICCNKCDKILVENIEEKTKYSILDCKCGKKCVHIECGKNVLKSEPKCTFCKDYVIVSEHCSTLRSTLQQM